MQSPIIIKINMIPKQVIRLFTCFLPDGTKEFHITQTAICFSFSSTDTSGDFLKLATVVSESQQQSQERKFR